LENRSKNPEQVSSFPAVKAKKEKQSLPIQREKNIFGANFYLCLYITYPKQK